MCSGVGAGVHPDADESGEDPGGERQTSQQFAGG